MPQKIIKQLIKSQKKDRKKTQKPKMTLKDKIDQIAKQGLRPNFEKILRRKEKRLKKQLTRIARKRKTLQGDYRSKFPVFGRGKDEDAQEVTQYESRLSMEHQLEIELEKIQRALRRISEGKYGICLGCGKKIRPERLKIYPEAEHCMSCHQKGEGV